MTGRDLLESGSARSRSRVALRGRAWVVAILVLVGLAVVLAARSSGQPAAAPARRPVAPVQAPVVRPPSYYLYDAAVGLAAWSQDCPKNLALLAMP